LIVHPLDAYGSALIRSGRADSRGAEAPPREDDVDDKEVLMRPSLVLAAMKQVVVVPRLLRGTMQALLAGPARAERARGYGGWFSAKTAGHLRSVRISDLRGSLQHGDAPTGTGLATLAILAAPIAAGFVVFGEVLPQGSRERSSWRRPPHFTAHA
jgi:hypothetical protein